MDPVTLQWNVLEVYEKDGVDGEMEKNEYENKLSHSKIIQVNETDVYIIGGNNLFRSLLKREYDAPKSCLLLNNHTGKLIQKKDMEIGRGAHSLCCIGNLIYVIGGAEMFISTE